MNNFETLGFGVNVDETSYNTTISRLNQIIELPRLSVPL